MRTGKKLMTLLMSVCMLLTMAAPLSASAEAGQLVTNIVLETETMPLGQFPTQIVLTVSDPEAVKDIKAEDFSILVEEWNSWNYVPQDPVEMKSGEAVTAITFADNTMTLKLGKFPERYYLMRAFTVTCAANEALSFTMADIDETINHAMEPFTFVEGTREVNGSPMQFNYYEHIPENVEGPCPLVMYIHGFTETWTPFANRWSAVFTEEYVQSNNPCYVIVPQFEDNVTGNRWSIDANMIIDETVKVIEGLIADGKVDANRVYVAGKSMGGGNTYNAIDRHPDLFAAAIIACAAGYSDTNGTLTENVGGIPAWIIYSESDSGGIVSFNRGVYENLQNAGYNFFDKRLEVSAEQVDACFTDSPHHIELLATESKTYIDWLFAQTKVPVSDKIQYAKAHAKVTAQGTVIDSISLLLTPEGAPQFTVGDTATKISAENIVTISGLNLAYGSEFEVTSPEGYSFTSADIRDYSIDTADKFLRYSYEVSNTFDFDYDMFVPQITPGKVVGDYETRPIIVVLNDGDDVLLDNRGVIAWADQTTLSAYVIAPSLNADKAIENTLAKIQYMAEKGLISDVYVTGTNGNAIINFVNAVEGVKAFSVFTLDEIAANEGDVVNALFTK